MSYDIIKRIKIKEDKVFITSASNNVRPHTYYDEESRWASKILQKQGREALDIELLRAYELGNFQRGNNKYTRALAVLLHFPEYKKFDWRNLNISFEDNRKLREGDEFRELLKKALVTYLPKDKFIITKQDNGMHVYLYKTTRKYAKWGSRREKAKIFNWKEDTEDVRKWFINSENWVVEKI